MLESRTRTLCSARLLNEGGSLNLRLAADPGKLLGGFKPKHVVFARHSTHHHSKYYEMKNKLSSEFEICFEITSIDSCRCCLPTGEGSMSLIQRSWKSLDIPPAMHAMAMKDPEFTWIYDVHPLFWMIFQEIFLCKMVKMELPAMFVCQKLFDLKLSDSRLPVMFGNSAPHPDVFQLPEAWGEAWGSDWSCPTVSFTSKESSQKYILHYCILVSTASFVLFFGTTI